MIELQRTARGVLLCAGMLTDAIEKGTVWIRLSDGAPVAPGGPGLRVEVWMGEQVSEPQDAKRLRAQLEPATSGSMRMNAPATALALVDRIARLQHARLFVETRTADGWPRFTLEFPPCADRAPAPQSPGP